MHDLRQGGVGHIDFSPYIKPVVTTLHITPPHPLNKFFNVNTRGGILMEFYYEMIKLLRFRQSLFSRYFNDDGEAHETEYTDINTKTYTFTSF